MRNAADRHGRRAKDPAAWGTAPLGRNLPDALREVEDVIPRGLLPIMAALVIIIGLLLILIDAPPVILPGCVAPCQCSSITVRALSRQTEIERGELRLQATLDQYRPEFVVYFASTVRANYQVGMWLPYFLRIGRPFIIVTRTAPMLSQIGELCDEADAKVPLIHRKTLRSIEEIIVDSMTTAFYVNNAARNTHLVERRADSRLAQSRGL